MKKGKRIYLPTSLSSLTSHRSKFAPSNTFNNFSEAKTNALWRGISFESEFKGVGKRQRLKYGWMASGSKIHEPALSSLAVGNLVSTVWKISEANVIWKVAKRCPIVFSLNIKIHLCPSIICGLQLKYGNDIFFFVKKKRISHFPGEWESNP